MTRIRDFAQVDVFSTEPYRGNPLAVILDAEGLSDEEMLRIANWTNLSETTFLFPPITPGADYLVRIFTPTGELPFAGHPTLGSAHAWLENGGTPQQTGTIIQECEAGLVEIRNLDGQLFFAAPPTTRSGPLEEAALTQLCSALAIPRTDILGHQWVDNGPGWCAIQLGSAEEVLALEPDFQLAGDLKFGVIGAYPEGSDFAFEIRAFIPFAANGEDPVTGSLNASVAQWLHREGQVAGSYRVSQGTRLGRSGSVSIECVEDGEIWVGGAVATCFGGTAQA
ncbi:Trans-2,3-dihydro-3-hydroxyanthranilate isomerase [Corynebacterium occultum]|uniref:Trans-2,3-dihydro-3-hydroxyanthranilate isomerase n=1 Tax=Corynebacterium occultum TaxID=2675219 RepID=A0A6B8W962_9CORY|nr:PhzF family phenazine biosynthesis protein [Corynebacterium occultum]QGU08497.1 Trans-2,3-dihydro-3-hydroxyanthranilate isomerase [Corynebacterium occultum]